MVITDTRHLTTLPHDPDHQVLTTDPTLTITTLEGKRVAVLPSCLGPTLAALPQSPGHHLQQRVPTFPRSNDNFLSVQNIKTVFAEQTPSMHQLHPTTGNILSCVPTKYTGHIDGANYDHLHVHQLHWTQQTMPVTNGPNGTAMSQQMAIQVVGFSKMLSSRFEQTGSRLDMLDNILITFAERISRDKWFYAWFASAPALTVVRRFVSIGTNTSGRGEWKISLVPVQ